MNGDLFDHLKLFSDLSPAQRALVKPLFIPQSEFCGTFLFEQGDPAYFLYLLVEGEILIQFKPDDGPLLTVTKIHPEGVVGWSAALGNPTYTSSALCSADCWTLRVRGEDLRSLCERHPDTGEMVVERLAEVIAERMRNTYPQIMALLEQGLGNGEKKQMESGKS
jgi:CRP-like cAMP-binding protein